MSTVNFSVPDDVKDAFNAAFEGKNKSAVIADLMREAVERVHKRELHHRAIANILADRATAPVATDAQIEAARHEGRP